MALREGGRPVGGGRGCVVGAGGGGSGSGRGGDGGRRRRQTRVDRVKDRRRDRISEQAEPLDSINSGGMAGGGGEVVVKPQRDIDLPGEERNRVENVRVLLVLKAVEVLEKFAQR